MRTGIALACAAMIALLAVVAAGQRQIGGAMLAVALDHRAGVDRTRN